jgi:uncharacterized protein (TIGR03382 family)
MVTEDGVWGVTAALGAEPIRAGVTWQWQLDGSPDLGRDVELYDLDLFDTPDPAIDTLHDRGVRVICYFSAGTVEEWRKDADAFPEAAVGKQLPDYGDERWLDVRDPTVRELLGARLDLAVEKGCDGVEPDNVDAWDNDPGFPLTREDQLDFLRFLAGEAHARDLAVGLKNAVALIGDVHEDFDFAVNEECLAYDECGRYAPFVDSDRAVLHVEYVGRENRAFGLRDDICDDPTIRGFSTLVKTPELDDFAVDCTTKVAPPLFWCGCATGAPSAWPVALLALGLVRRRVSAARR